MGDLKGHAIPGSFFFLFGLWSAFGCLRRHLASLRNGAAYQTSSTYPLDCFGPRVGRHPIEGYVKVLLSAAGALGELLAHLPVPPTRIVMHASMYLFFFLSGAVDLAVHAGLALPPKIEFVSLGVAMVIEGLLFVSHVSGRAELDSHVHMLLVYVIFTTAAVIALEAKYNQSVILSLTRAYLLMLQGTWFWAVGIIMYGHGEENTAWMVDAHHSIMDSTVYFSWHCAVNFLILVALNVLLSCCSRRKKENNLEAQHRDTSTAQSATSNKNEIHTLLSDEDSEET